MALSVQLPAPFQKHSRKCFLVAYETAAVVTHDRVCELYAMSGSSAPRGRTGTYICIQTHARGHSHGEISKGAHENGRKSRYCGGTSDQVLLYFLNASEIGVVRCAVIGAIADTSSSRV